MLMRTDPFRDLDRFAQQLTQGLGGARTHAMPLDAWRENDDFVVELDLPGVDASSIAVDVERNVLTVRAERPHRASDADLLTSERPRGSFSRSLFLGDALDTEKVSARYDAGVLTLRIPVADRAKPRKVHVETTSGPLEIKA